MSDLIKVSVVSQYLPEQSVPDEQRFVFAYTVTLTNDGDEGAQLVSRHWVITDGNDEVQEVKGMGVVGEQPYLEPGESYTYSSGAVLTTDTGTMTGSYQMKSASGETFEAQIPTFALVQPSKLN